MTASDLFQHSNATEPKDPADVQAKAPSRYLMTRKGYLHPMRTYVWITLFIVGLMSALWFVVGIGPDAQGTIPPAFAFGASDLYFHSIAIGIASLAVYLVIMAFDLEKYEPNIDFPMAYRATLATIIGAIGAVFYLQPVYQPALAPIPLGLILLGLILLGDVGGALLIQLYLLPAKITGRYDSSKNILGMIPRRSHLPTWSDFKKMDASYWLTFVTVISTFIAGMIGFVVFWLNYFVIDIGVSPSIFSGYITWMGGAATFLGYTMGSHSHVIGMTIILGVVAVVAKRFGVLNLTGLKQRVAKFGMWVSGVGILVMTTVFLLEAFTNVWPDSTPPLLFASNPGGFQLWSYTAANGMAGDDSTMFLASAGAMIMFIPLLFTPIRGRPAWKDPIRLSILSTWILAYIATPIEGFFIEFNEATLGGAPADIVFGNQQYFALFGITLVAMAFLAVDFFQDERGTRSVVAALGMLVTTFTVIVGYIYAFLDPGVLNPDGTLAGTTTWGLVYAAGLLLVSLVAVVATVAVFRGAKEPVAAPRPVAVARIARRELPTHEALGRPAGAYLVQHSWEPEATPAAVSMLQGISTMAEAGALPEGFALRSMQLLRDQARAFSTWDAPSRKDLEGFVMRVNLPKIRVVYELQNLY